MTGVPEWVYVWWWARERGEERFFPQASYETYVLDALDIKRMSVTEYDELREKWVAAGAPKVIGTEVEQ